MAEVGSENGAQTVMGFHGGAAALGELRQEGIFCILVEQNGKMSNTQCRRDVQCLLSTNLVLFQFPSHGESILHVQ